MIDAIRRGTTARAQRWAPCCCGCCCLCRGCCWGNCGLYLALYRVGGGGFRRGTRGAAFHGLRKQTLPAGYVPLSITSTFGTRWCGLPDLQELSARPTWKKATLMPCAVKACANSSPAEGLRTKWTARGRRRRWAMIAYALIAAGNERCGSRLDYLKTKEGGDVRTPYAPGRRNPGDWPRQAALVLTTPERATTPLQKTVSPSCCIDNIPAWDSYNWPGRLTVHVNAKPGYMASCGLV